MKVLHLVPSLVGGGAERQLAYLCTAMANSGVETHIGYLFGGRNLSVLQGGSVTLHQLSASGAHDPRIVIGLCKLMRSLKINIVQTWLLHMDVFGGVASSMCSIPWVLSERSSAFMYERGWKFRIRDRIGATAAAIIANSEGGMDYWRSISKSPLNRVIRNIVPIDEIARAKPVELSTTSVLTPGRRLIVVAGRLSAEKNLDTLLKAIALVFNEVKDVDAVILGEGALQQSLASLRDSLSCADRIHFLGYSDELWGWLKAATAYVSLSHFEGTPNTVLEAIAAQCPVIASGISAHHEILDDTTATFVDQDSVQSVAEGLIHVLGNPVIVRAMASRAYARIPEWTADAVLRQYLAVYQDILSVRA